MKRVFIACVAFATSLTISAQETMGENEYKFNSGDSNLEVLVAPLGGSPVFLSGIKFRHFNSSTSALRGAVFIGYNSDTEIIQQSMDMPEQEELRLINTEFSINIQPGMEWHMAGTERLSPYYGVVLNLGYTRMAEIEEYEFMDPSSGETSVEDVTSSSAELNLGLNGVAGVDYYFAKNFYFGAEIGFGVNYTSLLPEKTEDSAPDTEDSEIDRGGSIGIGPNFVTRFRLGWLF